MSESGGYQEVPRPGPTLSSLRSLLSPVWPDPLDRAAYLGLAGELVELIGPHTEADPAALLLDFLVSFGSAAGRNSFIEVDGARHYPNLFGVLVGRSSKARKGTSRTQIARRFEEVAPEWSLHRVQGGLSSGEGLIWAVRDPISKSEPVKQKGQHTGDYQEIVVDPGVEDKRLLAVEQEFGSVLKVLKREGNTVSTMLRQAWDSGTLRTMTKNSPAIATDAHISLIGHITGEELRRLLDSTEAANGFGNRILWSCVERSKCLPEGGNLREVDFSGIQKRLLDTLARAQNPQQVRFDDEARRIWHDVYPDLSEGGVGLFGAVTSRAEAQTLRLALVYALLDRSDLIRAEHLRAALALWRRCEQSARYVFGDSMGDPVADDILENLKQAGDAGMNRTAIRDIFGRHQSSARVKGALTSLKQNGLARMEKVPTEGRPQERWYATTGATKATEATKGGAA